MKRRDLLGAAVASLAGAPLLRRARAAGMRKLKVGTTPLPEASGLYVAIEKGYFRAAGLDIEPVQVPSTVQLNTMLISGQIDAMTTGLAPMLLNAISKGADFRIVAPRQFVSVACGNVGTIYALKTKFPKGLSDITALKGRTVGVGSVVGFTEFAVDLQLEKAGLADHSVEYVHLPSGQGAAALLNGRVDALAVLPESARALRQVTNDIVSAPSLASMYAGIQHSFVYFGPTLLKTDRDAGMRFVAAFLHGNRDYRGGANPQFLKDFAAKSGLNPSEFLTSCRDDMSVDAHIDRANLERFAQWAVRRQYAQKLVAFSELVDEGFAGKA